MKKENKKPKLNLIASIVNNHFLDSDYQGKNWEEVRKSLILELKNFISQLLSQEEANWMAEIDIQLKEQKE